MLPQSTAEQRDAALALARAARRQRAEVKELLSTGSLTLSEVMARADDDSVLAGTKVAPLLVALPGMGKVKTKRLMEEIGIHESRTLKGLGRASARPCSIASAESRDGRCRHHAADRRHLGSTRVRQERGGQGGGATARPPPRLRRGLHA